MSYACASSVLANRLSCSSLRNALVALGGNESSITATTPFDEISAHCLSEATDGSGEGDGGEGGPHEDKSTKRNKK